MDSFWAHYGKRSFDVLFAGALIVLLWPVMLCVALLVRSKLGSPVLFKQQRLGKDTKEFLLFKFRSMSDDRDADGRPLPDEERLGRFGALLRSTSLDELPQIINVLKGEMSLIGPRAMLPDYKELLLERYPERFKVLPGITSLPAIRGRNTLPWDRKFSMDVEYVERFGFSIDVHIFLHTIPVVLGRKGISMPGVATATRYDDEVRKSSEADQGKARE